MVRLRDRLDALKACPRSVMRVACLPASHIAVCRILQTGSSIKRTGLLHHAYISQRFFAGEACRKKRSGACRIMRKPIAYVESVHFPFLSIRVARAFGRNRIMKLTSQLDTSHKR